MKKIYKYKQSIKHILSVQYVKYNTGWMPGDIKLATLSDTTVENIGVNSDELVDDGERIVLEDTAAVTEEVGWIKAELF